MKDGGGESAGKNRPSGENAGEYEARRSAGLTVGRKRSALVQPSGRTVSTLDKYYKQQNKIERRTNTNPFQAESDLLRLTDHNIETVSISCRTHFGGAGVRDASLPAGPFSKAGWRDSR